MSTLPNILKPTNTKTITLPSGKTANLPTCRPLFEIVPPNDGEFTFGGKPLAIHRNERIFVELRIARELALSGWNAVWVETFNGPAYLTDMPTNWKILSHSIPIPADKLKLVEEISKRAGRNTCFDVLAWLDDTIYFFEAKRRRRDRISKNQRLWIEAALQVGLPSDNLIIVEWDAQHSSSLA